MNIGPLRSFFGALYLQAKNREWLGMMLLLFNGIVFLFRLVRYEGLFPVKCQNCGAEIKVYFMRPRQFIDGQDGSISDWLICQNQKCLAAYPLS